MMGSVNRKDRRQGGLFPVDFDGPFASVVINRPVEQAWTYRVPERLQKRLRKGARVRVPLGRGNQAAIGYCVGLDVALPEGLDPGRVKDLLEVLDDPPLIDQPMLDLTRWLATYYACSWGQALDAVVPSGVRKAAGTRLLTCLVLPEELRDQPDPPGLTPKQAEVIALLRRSTQPVTVPDVCRLLKCTSSPVLALRSKGHLHTVRRRLDRLVAAIEEPGAGAPQAVPTWTAEQKAVLERLREPLANSGFAAFLVHGVTGSGKTEVYLSAIEQVVARGREAIVLVPEISLTPQTIRRFRRRFDHVAVLHSHLSDVERHHHWRRIADGEIQVVVGARSAVFAPARKLGLIVIDEEHESSFKQESTPRYHARDIAVKRAQMLSIPVIMGSATPALETWRNAQLGRYTRLSLSRRVLDRPMPPVEVVDMRYQEPQRGAGPPPALSRRLRDAMQQALDDDGQILLLLNRRGFHTFMLCPRCGHVFKCRHCDIALTHHKGRKRALCHTCDAQFDPPEACPSCQNRRLHFGGTGTERLEREVQSYFPVASIQRMDSDTMRAPGSHERTLAAFKEGEIRILLGTQMIAKGLDFPNVTLVGVVDADTALHLPDFRAAERTFQLVAQVAGRTGRGDRPGRVIVQTYCPEDPAIALATRHDYLAFAAQELEQRQNHKLPPYCRMVRIVARGLEAQATLEYMQYVAELVRKQGAEAVRLQGPAPAPIERIQGRHRFHLRLLAAQPGPLQVLLHAVLPLLTPPSSIELVIDVDPIHLL